MKLPAHIEKEFREYAKEIGMDEDQYVQSVLSCAQVIADDIRLKKQKRLKQKQAA